MESQQAQAYIRKIRNTHKRLYAEKYLEWKLNGETGKEPERKELSYMAAQSVRLEIANILK